MNEIIRIHHIRSVTLSQRERERERIRLSFPLKEKKFPEREKNEQVKERKLERVNEQNGSERVNILKQKDVVESFEPQKFFGGKILVLRREKN